MNTNNIFETRSLIQNAQSVLIALAEANDEDVVAAGLSLYLTFTKMRKQVTIVSSQQVKVKLSYLFGIDKITNKMAGGNSLVISMPYQEGTIEKVSYHIDNNRFNLVIEPRGEKLDFDPNQVDYNYGRGDYDTVFVLGAHNVSALGEIYNRHKNVFTQKPLINIDNSNDNTRFGKINLIDDMPVSQIVAQLVKDLRLPIDQDAASNLYTGIMKIYGSATLSELDPRSLDALSFLGRMKAQNLHDNNNEQKSNQQNQQKHDTIAGVKADQPIKQEVIPNNNTSDQTVQNSIPRSETQTPEDWLKPKIFTTK